ncbi:multicopper oxidase domain-containing protein [Sphaerimonospora sp. CA-214678]|uniref:multicopper oxidase domain-containing protein n=1 Tax=Sphaerimonospora sp. CA-214678 TaxID=3240029 RepID=UPI003D939D93
MRKSLIVTASALSAVLVAGAGFGAGVAAGDSGHDPAPMPSGMDHPETEASGHDDDPQLTTEDGHDHSAHQGSEGTPATYDPNAEPGPGFRARDAVLPAAGKGREHRVTLTVTEQSIEVTPGVRQRAWTYNGTLPGPILRGKLGDTFVITLVNKGSTGHSIDFHASQVAPDKKMRTIQPGQQLTYTFKAERAGAFMYHCGSAPAVHHIGNGMFGAIIIDPPDLPKVDKEFVVVQSELALGPQDGLAKLGKLYRAEYDAVAFNGYAGQYRFAPLTATAGKRVRIWVVDAGPSAPSAFHVVGTVFDTVFKDGGYTVRPKDTAHGGAQALDLAPSQGGFVEFAFPEPGEYPMVSHRFADAARGATGLFKVGTA